MSLKEIINTRIIRGRKPASLISDVIFFGLILMLLIPSTRRVVFSGVAAVRTMVSNPAVPAGRRVVLDDESWNWSLADLQSGVFQFRAFRGEVVFINQWATWCPPCRAEMPSIERLYRDYSDRVKFVLLTSEDPLTVKKFLERQGYKFPVFIGQTSGSALSTRSIPSTVIIGRQGEIVVSRKGSFNWNSRKIRKLLDQMLAE